MDLLTSSYMDRLIHRITEKINAHDKNGLVSVILSGSLGRDEGTFHVDPQTSALILDSDVELALVYKFGKKKQAEKIRNILISDFEEDMNPMVISAARVKCGYNFNYSVFPPKRSSIFMYDLYHGSRTIWGKDLLDKKVQPYDPYEAKRIVANRIGELTFLETNGDGCSETLKKQWEGKVLLALGSAYCILENAYVSQYKGQKNFIVENKTKADKVMGDGFAQNYELAYLYLREGHPCSDISRETLRAYVKNAKSYFEDHMLVSPKINSLSRSMKYAFSCVKSGIKMNPLTCEALIIESLIDDFILGDSRIVKTAKNWKNVLY